MKIPCKECGALILQQTASRNGGLCAPCRDGTRDLVEAARIQRETEQSDPFHILFRRVRDHAALHGLTTLLRSEAIYYAVASLFSDLNRGAVQLIFHANNPDFQKLASDGLAALGRGDLLKSLATASKLCAEQDVWHSSHRSNGHEPPHEDQLSHITDELLQASEDVFLRLERFAVEHGLVSPGTSR